MPPCQLASYVNLCRLYANERTYGYSIGKRERYKFFGSPVRTLLGLCECRLKTITSSLNPFYNVDIEARMSAWINLDPFS